MKSVHTEKSRVLWWLLAPASVTFDIPCGNHTGTLLQIPVTVMMANSSLSLLNDRETKIFLWKKRLLNGKLSLYRLWCEDSGRHSTITDSLTGLCTLLTMASTQRQQKSNSLMWWDCCTYSHAISSRIYLNCFLSSWWRKLHQNILTEH